MTANTFMLSEEQAPTQEETMAPFAYPNNHKEIDDIMTTNETFFNDTEEFSPTISPSSSQDWSSEEYPSDEEDDDDSKVNGTGLVLYVTPTATKAAYWKRRLGWKPNMSKTITKKVKKALFRRPASNSVRTGRSYEIHGADALVVNPNQVAKNITFSEEERKQVSEEDIVLEHEPKDFDAAGTVNHDLLVFA